MSARKPLSVRLRNRVKGRFVAYCEVAGYAICAAVFAFSAYALVVRRDIIVNLNGPLEPGVEDIDAAERLLVFDVDFEPGQGILPGDLLLRVVGDPEPARRAAARLALGVAAESLEGLAGADSREAALRAREAMAALPEVEAVREVLADAAGIAYPRVPLYRGAWVDEGEPLVRQFDLGRLLFTSSMNNQGDARRVSEGDPATIDFGEAGGVIEGVVESVVLEGAQLQYRIVFVLDDPVGKSAFFREHYANALLDDPPRVTVRVLAGSRTLFGELFGRR